MSLATAAPESTRSTVAVDAISHGRRAWFLLAFAAWNVFVWGTRLRNLFEGDEVYSTAFIVVHTVLYIGGFGGAAVLTTMAVRMRREIAASTATSSSDEAVS